MGKQPYSIDTIFINRPTVADYGNLSNNIKGFIDGIIKEGLKPNHVLRIVKRFSLLSKTKDITPKQKDFWELPWGDLILLREVILNNNMLEALRYVFDIEEEDFLRLDIFNCFAAYKWINQQLNQIGKIESQELGTKPTQDEKNAGVDELEKFGAMASVDNLAKGNIMKYNDLLNKPYSVIFQKMCLEKTKNDIQKRFIDNANRKARANSRKKRF